MGEDDDSGSTIVIVVIVVTIVILIIVGVVLFWWIYRKKKAKEKGTTTTTDDKSNDNQQLSPNSKEVNSIKAVIKTIDVKADTDAEKDKGKESAKSAASKQIGLAVGVEPAKGSYIDMRPKGLIADLNTPTPPSENEYVHLSLPPLVKSGSYPDNVIQPSKKSVHSSVHKSPESSARVADKSLPKVTPVSFHLLFFLL